MKSAAKNDKLEENYCYSVPRSLYPQNIDYCSSFFCRIGLWHIGARVHDRRDFYIFLFFVRSVVHPRGRPRNTCGFSLLALLAPRKRRIKYDSGRKFGFIEVPRFAAERERGGKALGGAFPQLQRKEEIDPENCVGNHLMSKDPFLIVFYVDSPHQWCLLVVMPNFAPHSSQLSPSPHLGSWPRKSRRRYRSCFVAT